MHLEMVVTSHEMEPNSSLYSEEYCHPLCNLHLDVSTALPSMQTVLLMYLHVKRIVLPWLMLRSRYFILCDNKHTVFRFLR